MSESNTEVVDKVEETKVENKEETTDNRTAEEIEAEAKELEAEIKSLKQEKDSQELKFNQTRRLEKARQKLAELKEESEQPKKVANDLDVRDLITLGKVDIAEDSEQAQILQKYKNAGIITDYASGLNNVAIKAEFEAVEAKNNATVIVDENDTDGYLKSKKEIIAQYKRSGNVPEDPNLRNDLALDNLSSMGL